jgi:hypothetical protein
MDSLLRESEWYLEDELEDELESESMPHRTAQFTVKLNLLKNGFLATTDFLDGWIKRSSAGLIGTSLQFRQRFCNANHYQVNVQLSGKMRTLRVVELWGFPVIYYLGKSNKPLLARFMPRGWHLKQVGRSVPSPQLCSQKP